MTEEPGLETHVPREGETGCAVVGTSLLIGLGLLQGWMLLSIAFPPARDPAQPSMGMEGIAYVVLGGISLMTAFALLVAALPRRLAPRPLRWVAGTVGAVLLAGWLLAVLRALS